MSLYSRLVADNGGDATQLRLARPAGGPSCPRTSKDGHSDLVG